jgi:hypothetical protein
MVLLDANALKVEPLATKPPAIARRSATLLSGPRGASRIAS